MEDVKIHMMLTLVEAILVWNKKNMTIFFL